MAENVVKKMEVKGKFEEEKIKKYEGERNMAQRVRESDEKRN